MGLVRDPAVGGPMHVQQEFLRHVSAIRGFLVDVGAVGAAGDAGSVKGMKRLTTSSALGKTSGSWNGAEKSTNICISVQARKPYSLPRVNTPPPRAARAPPRRKRRAVRWTGSDIRELKALRKGA